MNADFFTFYANTPDRVICGFNPPPSGPFPTSRTITALDLPY